MKEDGARWKAHLNGSRSHAEVMNKSWNGKTLTDLKGSIKLQRTEEFAAFLIREIVRGLDDDD